MERVRAVEESVKSAHHRIDEVQENQKILMDMNASIKALTEQSKSQKEDMQEFKKDIKGDIDEVKTDVKDLKEKPVKKWDALTNSLITVLVSGVVGAIIGALLALIMKRGG
jgi:chromosome segregation ATPase